MLENISRVRRSYSSLLAWSLAALALSGCDRREEPGWKVVGELTDGLKTQFVEIQQGNAHARETYDAAVATLCKDRGICQIAFFQAGDRIPLTQNAQAFIAHGGLKEYQTLAVWMSNSNSGLADYTGWDCQRAGAAGAPFSALCDDSMRETYSALVQVAMRNAMAEQCNWGQDGGNSIAASFLASIKDVSRRVEFKKAFDRANALARGEPPNPDMCQKSRRRTVDSETQQAHKVLKAASVAAKF